MTLLVTWPETDPGTEVRRTTDPAVVEAVLAPLGVRYEQWPVRENLRPGAGEAAVLGAYRAEVGRLKEQERFSTVDVVSLHPDGTSEWRATASAARERFLSEHTHDDDDEVRFFVHGAGAFYLHVHGEVHAVRCEAGDLLGLPRGMSHWFDMGSEPSFTAIRFFHEEDGWVGTFSGSGIAARFPGFETLHAGSAA
ncbi:acireductone dioxygenase [Streptomyces sp. WMMB 322]|uniref:1,2-dihydroxy-3-keto-5-methylthiopentene dioxygenase n=1 Tax=Streptomyces sp. WMMB 322 TaxID=1286821 RepID=UPI0006E14A38|nr:cupin [Streptomyces sp. WMMB 322]SCK10775.1 acireductone dioxygenase apoprotein [Streptomyces sp. WMMB 322]